MKTLESLRRDKYRGHAATSTGYFDHVFAVKQPHSAAQLESLIGEFVSLSGGVCTKVSVMGREVSRTTKTKHLGMDATVTNSSYIPSSTKVGTSDLIIGFRGRIIYCEVKFSKGDRLSQAQKDFKRDVENAGCEYWVVKTLSEFEMMFSKFVVLL